jgi:hypothetical protein
MRIYLSGATTDWDNPIGWHKELREKYDCEFVNPYEITELDDVDKEKAMKNTEKIVEPAWDWVEKSDGMLVKWCDDYQMPGCATEMKHAYEHDIPIVIQKDEKEYIHTDYMADATFEDLDKCLRILRMLIKRNQ